MTEEALKLSRYNLMFDENNEYSLLANSLSGAIIRIDKSTRRRIERLFNELVIYPYMEDKRLISLLTENGFLISEIMDELAFLRKIHEEAKKGEKALGIGIAPTLGCNFRCVYCYQNHQPADMSREVQYSIIEYVKKNITGHEILYVDWFGGEPLLKLKVIERLTNELMNIARQNKCEYHGRITTNGYILTKSVAKLLNRCGISVIQVTLDGPAEIHDKRRLLKSGRGTFNTILKNVINSADLFEDFYLRINIDKNNSGRIIELLDILKPIKGKIALAFRPATSPEAPGKPNDFSLPPAEYRALQAKLISISRDKGFRNQIGYTLPGTSFCSAYQKNAVMVDPYGDVHLCPVCVGRRKDRYGMLNYEGNITNISGIQSDWHSYNPMDDPECVECPALPLCMGGCLWFLNTPDEQSQRCDLRHMLEAHIKEDYTLDKFLFRSRGGEPSSVES